MVKSDRQGKNKQTESSHELELHNPIKNQSDKLFPHLKKNTKLIILQGSNAAGEKPHNSQQIILQPHLLA